MVHQLRSKFINSSIEVHPIHQWLIVPPPPLHYIVAERMYLEARANTVIFKGDKNWKLRRITNHAKRKNRHDEHKWVCLNPHFFVTWFQLLPGKGRGNVKVPPPPFCHWKICEWHSTKLQVNGTSTNQVYSCTTKQARIVHSSGFKIWKKIIKFF